MLHDWFTIEIEEVPCEGYHAPGTTRWIETSKNVYFCSRIHVNKRVKLTFSFSGEFSDFDILHDHNVMTKFIQMYGADSWV